MMTMNLVILVCYYQSGMGHFKKSFPVRPRALLIAVGWSEKGSGLPLCFCVVLHIL
jgi:hypothetical protein